jgi:integrase
MSEQTPIRVLGPYAFRDQWRCAIRNGQRKTYLSPENTPARALAVAERFVSELTASQPVTISAAIDRYQQYLKDKGNKPASYEITPLRLRRFFGSMLGAPLFSLTERRCQALYDGLRKQTSARTGKPLSVDTHRAYLADARSFGRWAVKGKPQLRHDEAHVWLNHGEALAQQGETGAVAAMMTLLMGLRCSEVVGRVVRDLDLGGTVLWIPDSKTEAGKRKVKVPAMLQPHLRALCRDKLPLASLFGEHDRDWPRHWVKRICALAKVPEVCAHSMRGLHATLAIEAGASPDVVARSLGHESATMTLSAYAAPGSAESANADRLHELLAKRPS